MLGRVTLAAVLQRVARVSGVVATGAVLALVMQLALKAVERWPWPRRAAPLPALDRRDDAPAITLPAGAESPTAPSVAQLAAIATAVDEADARGGSFEAWHNRSFAVYMCGMAIGFCAFWMYQTAQGWLALQLTSSPAGLSLLFTVSSFPMLILMLFGGALADRFDRKGVIIVSRLCQAVATALMGVLTLAGHMTIPTFVAFSLALGVIQALNLPARHSFLADLLPIRALHNGYSWQAVLDFTAATVGPVLAGYIVAGWGAGEALVIAGMGHVIMCAFVVFVRPRNRGSRSVESVAKRIAGGISYVARHQQVLLIIVLAVIPSFTVWGVMPLLPIVARDVLHGDAGTYGWLNGAMGVGSILGALFVAAAHGFARKGLLAVIGAAGTGLAVAAVAYTQTIEVALLFLLIMGAASGIEMTMNQSLVQVLTPSEYQGRVASIFMLTWNLQPIGIIIFAAIAQTQGVPFAFWLSGLAMSAAVIALAVARPALVRIRA